MNQENEITIDSVASILGWCFVFSIGVMIYWLLAILLLGDLAFAVHSKLFGLTREQFNLFNYVGMGLFKMVSFMIFLFPYLAIKLVKWKSR